MSNRKRKVMDWMSDMIVSHDESVQRAENRKRQREMMAEDQRLLNLDRNTLFGDELRAVKKAYERYVKANLNWYDMAMLDLYTKLGGYRTIESATGIPFETCYSTRKSIEKRLKKAWLEGLEINGKKKPSPENEVKMRKYLYKKRIARRYNIPKEDFGNNKKQSLRVEGLRAAALLTKPGEEKYTFIAEVTQIEDMKRIVKEMNKSSLGRKMTIKKAFHDAMAEYIKKRR